ncbi:uncharacterized protein BDZ99DRAFT_493926 [Mytilinidion resinicola]|uniref:Uncharacterized protein n=1 Tax=Mytilinidion resinicola TaxID=574789 RepID=A0A6A6Z6T8_9PEZI|nr:uncharacterized protein BDZ99DRAFT_493926 [Mytilinidion resinicola]KAF2816014.1 hypothetical protein BDZ99DRAFT_493926 [Mytilinidion resinicola]
MSSRRSSLRNPNIAPRRTSSIRFDDSTNPIPYPSFSSNVDWTLEVPYGQLDVDWSNVNFDDPAFSGYNRVDQQPSTDFLLDSLSYLEPEQQVNAAKSRRASVQMMNRPLAAVPGLKIPQSYDLSNNHAVDPSLLNSDYQNTTYGYQSEANAPYFTDDFELQPQVHDGFVPASHDAGTTADVYDDDLRSSLRTRKRSREDTTSQERPRKRAREEEPHHGRSPKSRRSSGNSSSLSETSSLRKSRKATTKITRSVYEPERPETDKDKHWIRINQTTEGKTSRTGKINHYKAEEMYNHSLPHTIGDWQGSKTLFQYDRNGELQQRTYSAKEIREFLYEHPRTKDCKLKLWIQKSPADSARRYPQEHSSKCRFRCCPIQANFKGTILHGHYRVAFDEKWHKYRENADPFHVAAYVHLYCLERFLDFPDICNKLEIAADDRRLRNEPKGRFLASLGNSCEGGIAHKFIEDCRNGNLHNEYPDYPIHQYYRHGEPKLHVHTLTYALNKGKTETRPPAQIRQFEERGLSSSHILVHMGDLEKFVKARLNKKKAAKRRKRGEPSEDEASDSEPEAVPRTARPRTTAAPKAERSSTQRPSRSQTASEPRRRSPRNKQRISYADMDAEHSDASGGEDILFIPEADDPYNHTQPYYPHPQDIFSQAMSLQKHLQQPRKSSLAQYPRPDRPRRVSWAPDPTYDHALPHHPEYQPEPQTPWPQHPLPHQPPLGPDYSTARKPSAGFTQLLDSITSYELDPAAQFLATDFDDSLLFNDFTNGGGVFAQPTSPARRGSGSPQRRRSSLERKVISGERRGSRGSPREQRRHSMRLRSRSMGSLGSLFGGSPSPPGTGDA